MGVEGTNKIMREMKDDFSQLNQTVTSHSASIKQLKTQLGQISVQLNARPKGELPSDIVVNPKNDAYIMTIVTRSSRTLGEDVVDLGEDPNEKANKKQANAKRKWLEELIDNDPKPNETSVERPMVVEENVKSEKTPKVIDDDTSKMDETLTVPLLQIKISPPFPQRLKKKDDDTKFKKFLANFSNLSVNIPLLEDLQEMLGYAKFIKDLVTKKRVMDFEIIEVTYNFSVIMSRKIVVKKEDPGGFTIPCIIGVYKFRKILCNIGASINLMPFVVFQKLGLGTPKPTTMRLLMADRSIKKPMGVLYDVLVKVDRFIFLADYVIHDFEIDQEVPIILSRPFLATARALVDVECGEIKFRVNNEEVSFNMCKSMKQSMDLQVISVIDVIDDEVANSVEMDLVNDPLVGVLWNFGSETVEECDEMVTSLMGLGSYTKNPVKLDLDLKNRESPPAKPSIIELPQLELNPLLSHLQYIFLGEDNTLPIIIEGDLEPCQVDALKSIMKKFIRAIG
ncbi:uncharacterized protein LOC107876513 [Capsicum annuum]|uniref:uncharacterized protein LOC107876513 n=1 Tax=Capsicum annuum TaxID=4072 RepID=UPI0007BEF5F1|nr:uncharacterized protein LOC107876513 [Capsicum annuum]